MRTGFLARGNMIFGSLQVSFGLGNPGTLFPPAPEAPEDEEVEGARAPRAVVTNKDGPKFNLYRPDAKKKKD